MGFSAGVSSMKIFASDSWLVAPVMRTQSSSVILPVRRLFSGTPPMEASMRVMTCSEGISMLKIATEARDAGIHRGVLGHVDRKRGLAHRRAAGDDHQVPGAQAAGQPVEIGEAGRQAAQLVRVVVPLVDLVDDRRQQRAHRNRAVALAEAAFGDLEHPLLGLVHQLARRLPVVDVHGRGDVGAGADQLPQQRALAHDVRVGADVGRGRGIAGDGAQVGKAAGSFELADALEVLGDGHHVARLGIPGKHCDRGVDQLVIVAIEVLGDQLVGDVVLGARIDEQAAQDCLLGLDRMRRNRGVQERDRT